VVTTGVFRAARSADVFILPPDTKKRSITKAITDTVLMTYTKSDLPALLCSDSAGSTSKRFVDLPTSRRPNKFPTDLSGLNPQSGKAD
jgi:hypothetical protein